MSSSGLSQLPSGHGLTFDLAQRTLCVNGRRVLLDSRSALVFQALAEGFGQIVSKDTLLASAWPGRLVDENSLAKAISRLRAAIGGSGLAITAAYGRGYTLEQTGQAAAANEDQEKPVLSPERRPRARAQRILLAPVAIVLAASVAAFALERSPPDVAIRSTPPLTHDAADARATLLWVDDHPSNNRLEVDYLKARGIAVHLAESTDDALKLLRMNSYQLVLSDLGRGEDRLAGLKLTRLIKAQALAVPVIIYTMRPKSLSGQKEQRRMVAEAGANDLALTPAEVRSKAVDVLDKQAAAPRSN